MTSSDLVQIGTGPVSAVITNPEWEEYLLTWASREAQLRHSDVRVYRSRPCDESLERAWAESASLSGGLIVVGPVSPGILADLLFKSTDPPVRSAVAVVRPNVPELSDHASQTRSITVGFHGSASSEAALRWAITEAATRNVTVRAVLAWSENRYGPTEGAVHIDPCLHSLPGVAAASLAEGRIAATGPASSQVESLARRGTPARVLAHEAAGSDLLVVGAGRSSVHNRPICGTTTLGCVARSTVPVVIVPCGPQGESLERASLTIDH